MLLLHAFVALQAWMAQLFCCLRFVVGTNPASAAMAGMEIVIVKCDDQGNVRVDDLKAKAEQHKDKSVRA